MSTKLPRIQIIGCNDIYSGSYFTLTGAAISRSYGSIWACITFLLKVFKIVNFPSPVGCSKAIMGFIFFPSK